MIQFFLFCNLFNKLTHAQKGNNIVYVLQLKKRVRKKCLSSRWLTRSEDSPSALLCIKVKNISPVRFQDIGCN